MVRSGQTSLILVLATIIVMGAVPVLAQDDNAAKEAYNEGLSQMQQGNLKIAESMFKGAINADPNYVDAYLNLGVIYFQNKAYDDALEQFKKVVEIDPTSIDGFANLGRVQKILKLHAEAEAAFESALALGPENPDILKALGKLRYYNRRKYADAAGNMEKCHEVGGGDRETHYILGKAYQKLDRLTEAVASLKKALELKSDYYFAHFALGQIYLGQEKFSKAASSFKAAMRANTKKPKAAYNYAVAVESQDAEAIDANIVNWNAYVKLAKNDAKEKSSVAIAQQHVKDLEERKEKLQYE